MGMSTKSGDDELKSEINVTPMVDVMLVLLIIFMITASVPITGVDIALPAVTASKIENPEGKLVLRIDVHKKIEFAGTHLTWQELEVKLKTNAKLQAESELYIEADTKLPYGIVVTAMAVAKNAGVAKVMMLTEPTETLELKELDQTAAP
ncbi:MAG: Biopolymer transport protein ExbD/TolR [Deltaproteobacteria bacterium]|nr:Biopolymer transport protein ExbD/TolR [Deltaproteobacteria bacterium]